ncbi:MAG TPA: tRNA (adenosine(37)-N6)-threonylcarbamoyltransferase complex dimerization subunit type 1 TsaB [Candidatus Babeliales bacterium]|jgi:tRNA threonylcarbamoyladenosine biosynthesis protein TsaB|nr:tRNA (adenosine(37)-N6)-threonylcarbamoyltransferase complex dimerization subunit type 1 TsaB [Candidatus Babeliales bacterium]
MQHYIAIQNTYDVFEMALFINNKLIDHLQDDKRHTSKLFIPSIDQLCARNNIQFSDLSFCAVNCGPGPFSTLRSIIASVNGLHAATNIPLIGIDGLDATFLEFYDSTYANTVVLLHAFNNEVYYLIAQQNQIVATGYKKIDEFLSSYSDIQTYFIGNGVTLHQDLITQTYGNNAIMKKNNPPMCSVETIGRLGLDQFLRNQQPTGYLMPLHLKKHAVEL